MVEFAHSNIISPKIDLERSELRYIFYAHDQSDLIEDILDLGFTKKIYEQTPITKTVYFGLKSGLKPGLSIKARSYDFQAEENIWHMDEESLFNLLEIKSTVNQDEYFFQGLMEDRSSSGRMLLDENSERITADLLFHIQRASEDGLLRDSTLKTKSRVKKTDLMSEAIQSNLTLKEVVTLLCKSSPLDQTLSGDLITIMNNKIRPIYYDGLFPFIMTQYSRIHLIPKEERLLDLIRVTIDPGVEYYAVSFDDPKNYLDNPSLTGEYLSREKFCRLEFKVDPIIIREHREIERAFSKILRKYGCIAYISKKWSGVTLISERYIEKQMFWKEPLGVNISGFFPVDHSWFSYGEITQELHKIIENTESFSTYKKDPQILVKNQNFVNGYLGVPIPSLVITVEGPYITYNLPSNGSLVKMIENQPEFYIMEEYERPVRSTLVSSKKEMDRILLPSIEIEGYSFFRSYGFLVINSQSYRVYKLTIERKTDIKGRAPRTEVYCKMRYVGNKIGLGKINKQAIYSELQTFYEEFSPLMTRPISSITDEFLTSIHKK